MSREPFSLFYDGVLILIVRRLRFELNIFVLHQLQNLGRRFGSSKMHLSPPPPPGGLGCCPFQGCGSVVVGYSRCGSLNCCTLCCTLLFVHSSFAIILIGKRERELVALLGLSSWCLVMVVWLFLAVPVPRICLRFVMVAFPDHTHLLFLISYVNL